MELVTPQFGPLFYLLSLLVSGGLFFGLRRFFRQRLAAESTVLLATVVTAVVLTPVVLLALLWLYVLVRRPA